MIGVTVRAQISIAVLRARFTFHPRLRNFAEIHPPPMLPTVAKLYTITRGHPSAVSDNPYCVFRNFGSQNMMNHQMGSVMNFPIRNAHVWRYRSSVIQGILTTGSGGSLWM